jgi:hypothetical protein
VATKTPARTATPVNSWVVCYDYAAGPFTADAAARRLVNHGKSICGHAHEVIVSATRPVTAAERDTMRAQWDAPFLADPSDEEANAERSQLTADLAAAILAAPLYDRVSMERTRVGDMRIAGAGWSVERGKLADAAGPAGSPEWTAALGVHEHATLTSDGNGAIREAWCACRPQPSAGTWVRYEYWTAEGMERHGFVCPECRRLLQAG